MKSFLAEMMSGASGNISMMRVTVLLIVVGVLANWIYLTVHTGQKQVLDWEEVAVIVGALGAKVAQRPFERSGPGTDRTGVRSLPEQKETKETKTD